MTSEQLEKEILLMSKSSWQKVAMVIARVMHEKNPGVPKEREAALVFERIEALVLTGKLEAQGDIRKWRFSEVRLPALPPE
jgi:hypothetical protein